MKLEENKSRIWYKVIDERGMAADNQMEDFNSYIAMDGNKGKWYESPEESGSLLVSNPEPLCKGESRAFVVELSGSPQKESEGEIYMKKFRLVREITHAELQRLSI